MKIELRKGTGSRMKQRGINGGRHVKTQGSASLLVHKLIVEEIQSLFFGLIQSNLPTIKSQKPKQIIE